MRRIWVGIGGWVRTRKREPFDPVNQHRKSICQCLMLNDSLVQNRGSACVKLQHSVSSIARDFCDAGVPDVATIAPFPPPGKPC